MRVLDTSDALDVSDPGCGVCVGGVGVGGKGKKPTVSLTMEQVKVNGMMSKQDETIHIQRWK